MALLALVVALVVLIERFPASFALAWLPEASRPHVQIERASGTLWGGEAELASPWLPARQQISWQCRPAWSLRLVCTLDGALRGELSIDRAGRLEGRGLRANLPIQVSLQGAPRATVDQLELAIEAVRAGRASLAVEGSLTARGIMIAATPGRVQGIAEATADCSPSEQLTRCTIASRGEPPPVSGSVELSPTRTRGQLQVNLPGLPAQTVAW